MNRSCDWLLMKKRKIKRKKYYPLHFECSPVIMIAITEIAKSFAKIIITTTFSRHVYHLNPFTIIKGVAVNQDLDKHWKAPCITLPCQFKDVECDSLWLDVTETVEFTAMQEGPELFPTSSAIFRSRLRKFFSKITKSAETSGPEDFHTISLPQLRLPLLHFFGNFFHGLLEITAAVICLLLLWQFSNVGGGSFVFKSLAAKSIQFLTVQGQVKFFTTSLSRLVILLEF